MVVVVLKSTALISKNQMGEHGRGSRMFPDIRTINRQGIPRESRIFGTGGSWFLPETNHIYLRLLLAEVGRSELGCRSILSHLPHNNAQPKDTDAQQDSALARDSRGGASPRAHKVSR